MENGTHIQSRSTLTSMHNGDSKWTWQGRSTITLIPKVKCLAQQCSPGRKVQMQICHHYLNEVNALPWQKFPSVRKCSTRTHTTAALSALRRHLRFSGESVLGYSNATPWEMHFQNLLSNWTDINVCHRRQTFQITNTLQTTYLGEYDGKELGVLIGEMERNVIKDLF